MVRFPGRRVGPLLCLLALAGACGHPEAVDRAKRSAFPPGTPHDFADGAQLCESDGDCPNGLPCQRGLCANLYYQDEVDQGDDVFNPGCHFSYSDPACTQNRMFHSGDLCRDHVTLLEWVDNGCHDDMDLFTTNCNLVCQTARPRFDRGVCINVVNICGPGLLSARCFCYNLPPAVVVEG